MSVDNVMPNRIHWQKTNGGIKAYPLAPPRVIVGDT